MSYPKHYIKMRPPAVRAALAKRKKRPPPELEEAIILAVQADRAALHPHLKVQEQHIRLWKQLLNPAVAELRNVQHMQKLTLTYPTPERTDALTAYAGLLALVIRKFKLRIDACRVPPDPQSSDLRTPGEIAAIRTRAFPRGLPNGGRYWVDWVPPDRIEAIYALFALIPYIRGVRQKMPFPIVLDKATSAKRRATLIERTSKELEHIERRIAAELADRKLTETHVFKHQEIGELRIRVSQMQAAMHIISLLPPNALIPYTWHGVMTARTLPGQPRGVTVTPQKEKM